MFADIHSHILYGVDDGPGSLELSLEIIKSAAYKGARAIVATPHILDSMLNEERILQRFRETAQAVIDQKIDIDIYLGSEITFQFGIEDIISSSIGTYRGMGRYFLVETALTHYPKRFDEIITGLVSPFRRPIFAHPERVSTLLDNYEKIQYLRDKGVLIQINSSSLLKKFGTRIANFAWGLVDRGLVSFVASDTHDLESRKFNLNESYNETESIYGEDMAENLFYNNPLKVIFSENIS